MDEKISYLYFEVTNIWKSFCEEHNQLLDITCEEYSLLLKNKIDELEVKIIEKNKIIQKIKSLESLRQKIIDEINNLNTEVNKPKIKSVKDLYNFISGLEIEVENKHFFRFNSFLVDIIEKIQEQNKRNQLFINKAIGSLKQIRVEALGKKNFSTYSAKGSTVSSIT